MPHDVFLSYAHVDNQPFPPAEQGWVTTFATTLKKRIQRNRPGEFRLWMDPILSTNDLTGEIFEALEQSATLLIVDSPGFRTSPWCAREKHQFLRAAAGRGSRVFLVERDKVDPHPELGPDHRSYRFWEGDPLSEKTRTLGDPTLTQEDQAKYYAKLDDLVIALKNELEVLPGLGSAEKTPTIFLAETTDDLDARRDEVRRYLDQRGVAVVPDCRSFSRTSEAAFNAEVVRGLASCTLFVQLLSAIPGKKPPGAERSFVALQLDRARDSGLPILQWRDPSFDLKAVADAAHAQLLAGDTVLAVGIEEFKSEVVERLLQPAPAQRPARDPGMVFVNAEPNDLPAAQPLVLFLASHQVGYVLPLVSRDPAQVRADLDQNLLDCERVMVVYGSTTPDWVRQQLRYARKILPRRESELRALALYQAPPPEKSSVGFALPGQCDIDSSRGLDEAALRTFLDLEGGP